VAHSYSSLKLYAQCPRQYNEVRVLKLHPYTESPEAKAGTASHLAMEEALRDGKPLPPDQTQYQWLVDGYKGMLAGRINSYEHDFSLGVSGSLIAAFDWKNKFWNGKADVLSMKDAHAIVLDWKFGKDKYPDTEQLELMALFTFMAFQNIETVAGALVFAITGKTVTAQYTRKDFTMLYAKWKAKTKDVELAQASGVWEERPSHLCPWCPSTQCPNWREKK
jgi:hypothetical protein